MTKNLDHLSLGIFRAITKIFDLHHDFMAIDGAHCL